MQSGHTCSKEQRKVGSDNGSEGRKMEGQEGEGMTGGRNGREGRREDGREGGKMGGRQEGGRGGRRGIYPRGTKDYLSLERRQVSHSKEPFI